MKITCTVSGIWRILLSIICTHIYKLHMKVIGSICLSYGTEQSIVQQIPPFDDEVYHIYTQLLPLDQIEGDSQAQYIGGKLCVTAPHVLAY